MSTLTRRLQVLLDDERWERLERAADTSGQSIGALVRTAIDLAYPEGGGSRRAAAEAVLRQAPMPIDDWDVMKADLLER